MMMRIEPSMEAQLRYSHIAIMFHWAIALFIFFNLLSGFFADSFEQPLRGWLVSLHKSFGLTVLVLTVGRIAWRLIHIPPSHDHLQPWEQTLASFTHVILYALMLVLPISGWAIVSATPPPGSAGYEASMAEDPEATFRRTRPMKVFGVFEVPRMSMIQRVGETPGGIAAQRKLHSDLGYIHFVAAMIMIALLILHVLGALKHQFVDRQSQFERMWFTQKRKPQA
jgi:cytochrome b561